MEGKIEEKTGDMLITMSLGVRHNAEAYLRVRKFSRLLKKNQRQGKSPLAS